MRLLVGDLAGEQGQAAWRHQLAPQDRQRPGQDLDAGAAEVVGERALEREQDERLGALRVQPGGEEAQLAVGAVAAGRGVDEQDAARVARAHSSTSSTSAGACGMRSGWMMCASSSSPSSSRGPGREK